MSPEAIAKMAAAKKGPWHGEMIFPDGRGEQEGGRRLSQINLLHSKDFPTVVRTLSQRFPGETIKVLDEGAGGSPFHEELREEIRRVQMIVSQVLIRFTVELISAAFGDHIDGRDAAAKFRVHVGGFDPHFLHARR